MTTKLESFESAEAEVRGDLGTVLFRSGFESLFDEPNLKERDESSPTTSGNQAKRPTGQNRLNFIRPGERGVCLLDCNNCPPEVEPVKCPTWLGPESAKGRHPTATETHCSWPIQDEYLAGRLGRDEEENSRLWNVAKWVDETYRIAHYPVSATKPINLQSDNWKDSVNLEELVGSPDKGTTGSFGLERAKVRVVNINKLIVRVNESEIVALIDEDQEALDADKVLRRAGPRHTRVDLPSPIERVDAERTMRCLEGKLGILWKPVFRAIVEHATMSCLGRSQQTVGRDYWPAIGRQRLIDGLRIANSVRKTRNRRAEWTPLTMDDLIRDVVAAVASCQSPANDNGDVRLTA